VFSFASGNFVLTALAVLFVNAYNGVEANQEPVRIRVNLLQLRLDGPYFVAFLGN